MFGKVAQTPQCETTPFHPRSPYAISKVAGFELTRNYREAYGMFCLAGMLFNHESPRRGFEFVTRKITSTVARIKLGLSSELRLGTLASDALPWIAGIACLIGVVVAARGEDGDRRAFTLAVVASILFTPVVWLHYFALLYAPIAIWRQTLSVAWLLPLLFLLTPSGWTIHQQPDWRIAFGLAVAASAVVTAALSPRLELRRSPTESAG